MKEAVGGIFTIQAVIIFLVLAIGLLLFSVNYTKAFKVKNGIISIIEENEGLTDKAQEQIIKYLNNTGYYVYGSCSKIDTDYVGNEEAINGVLTGYERQGTTDKYKYCVFERTVENDALNRKYYRVTVFFKFDIPLLDNAFTFPVTGETKAVYFAE